LNILGIDFEEWYHPELVKPHIKNIKRNPSVINGIDKILDLLRKHETFATFFVVGELLEIQPDIFDKIIENDHEIGFHTMYHDRLDSPEYKEKFRDEIKKFAELTNHKSRGFRAPTFSLNNNSSWAIDILAENDYMYDSSVVPAKTSMYGLPGAQESPYKISSKNIEQWIINGRSANQCIIFWRYINGTSGITWGTCYWNYVKVCINKTPNVFLWDTRNPAFYIWFDYGCIIS